MSAFRNGFPVGRLLRLGREEGPPERARAFTLALFAAFVLAMLAMLLFGLQAYRDIVEEQARADERRLASGILVNTVKANDSLDALRVEQFEGNAMLSLLQRTDAGEFVTRLYVQDGHLMQQYTAATTPREATAGHELFPTESFSVDYEGGLLTMGTDPVTVSVALTCAQGPLDDARADDGEGGVS